jgi:HCOMODA/2-hydroxy-3-carboxy-muconic semialdehyde decarboxylase
MAGTIDDIKYELALTYRILANEGVLDTFGHVSVRHPERADRYLLSRSRAPELVEPEDLIEYDLDSRPISDSHPHSYIERVIHGEILKSRHDVMAVCHHHAEAFMPLVIARIDYVPVFHLGAVGGLRPPFWDQREEFGDTNMLVAKPEEGASLARALGDNSMVLMNRHGVTAVAASLRQLAFRCYYSCRNAAYQIQASAAGRIDPLSPGEIKHGSGFGRGTSGQDRAWENWTARLARAKWLPQREPTEPSGRN